MLSKNPSDIKAISAHSRDVEILRLAIIAELDAINLYEQLAASASNKDLKTRLLHVAKEEKTHVGEFQALKRSLPAVKPSSKKTSPANEQTLRIMVLTFIIQASYS